MTTTPTLSWGELWSVYRRSPAHMQQAILAQIDLPDIIKYSSKKVIAEVFEEAPDELKPPENIVDYLEDRVNIVRRRWGLKPILPKRRR